MIIVMCIIDHSHLKINDGLVLYCYYSAFSTSHHDYTPFCSSWLWPCQWLIYFLLIFITNYKFDINNYDYIKNLKFCKRIQKSIN